MRLIRWFQIAGRYFTGYRMKGSLQVCIRCRVRAIQQISSNCILLGILLSEWELPARIHLLQGSKTWLCHNTSLSADAYSQSFPSFILWLPLLTSYLHSSFFVLTTLSGIVTLSTWHSQSTLAWTFKSLSTFLFLALEVRSSLQIIYQ
jgi:hypothetical protein